MSPGSSVPLEAMNPSDPLDFPPDLLAFAARDWFHGTQISPLVQNPVAAPGSSFSRPVVESRVASPKLGLATSESPGVFAVLDAPTAVEIISPPVEVILPPMDLTQRASASPSLWASKFSSSIRNLKKVSPPSFLEDGTPSVLAPDSVLLQSYDVWKDHLVA